MSGYNSRKRRTPSVRSGGTSTPTTSSGRGVLPGSGSNNTVPTLGTRQPNINPSTGKSMYNPGYEEILGQFAGTSDLANSLLQLGVADPSHFQLSGDEAVTWNQQLLTILIQYLLTQDQRGYNEKLLNEDRLYKNPQNELARLMGAGISRDAALQLLSGSGGSGSGSALPYGDAATAPSMSDFASMMDARTNSFNSMYNASMGTINMVMDMVGFGFSVPQAIEQVKALQMQNYMSQEQIGAYKSSKQVTGVAQNLINSGAISYDEVQNAADLEEFLNNNKDNPNIKPLFDSGAFSGAFGTPFGREMMNKHWQQLRDSAHGGDLYGNFLRQSDLKSDLMEVGNAQARRDYYVSFATALNDILSSDVELAKLYQSYLNGEVQLEINGYIADITKYQKNAAYRRDFTENAYFTAFKDALSEEVTVNKDGRQVTMSGQGILNYNAFTALIRSYQQSAALSGHQGVDMGDKDGGTTIVSARERYERMLNSNIEVAITGAFIQDVINSNRLSGYSGDLAPIYRFADMWNASGLGNVVKSVSDVTPNVTVNTGDRFISY